MIGAKVISGFVDPAGNYIKLACFLVEAERDDWVDKQREINPCGSITTFINQHGLWAQLTVASRCDLH